MSDLERQRGYFSSGDWQRMQNARERLLMLLMARSLGVSDDRDLHDWVLEEEENARQQIAYYEGQAKEAMDRLPRRIYPLPPEGAVE